jgi:hypothetical protein
LHGAGDASVQFLPVDALGTLDRGVDAGFFQGDKFFRNVSFTYLLGISGRFPSRVPAG